MKDFETVDPEGNIWFVRGEGILVSFDEKDDTGAPVDPATHPRWLTIPLLNIRRTLGVDPGLSSNWRIAITPAELASLSTTSSAAFSITDEQGVVPVSLWAGVIRERNLNS